MQANNDAPIQYLRMVILNQPVIIDAREGEQTGAEA